MAKWAGPNPRSPEINHRMTNHSGRRRVWGNMHRATLAVLGLFLTVAAYGQPTDSLQTATATNLQYADSFVYLLNAGTASTPANGNVCANVYTFVSGSTLASCCSCLVTPNGLTSLSVIDNLHSGASSSATLKIVVSTPATMAPRCDPTTPTTANLSTGLRSWLVTFDTPSPNGGAEKTFQLTTPSSSDLNATAGACKTLGAQSCACDTP